MKTQQDIENQLQILRIKLEAHRSVFLENDNYEYMHEIEILKRVIEKFEWLLSVLPINISMW